MKLIRVFAIFMAIFLLTGCVISDSSRATTLTNESITITSSTNIQGCKAFYFDTLDDIVWRSTVQFVRATVDDVAYDQPVNNWDTYTLTIHETTFDGIEDPFYLQTQNITLERGKEYVLALEYAGGPEPFYMCRGEYNAVFTADDDGKLTGVFIDELLKDTCVSDTDSLETVFELLIERRQTLRAEGYIPEGYVPDE